mmetsp:Transcript_17487/g.67834  ORF Transcript_17487/g.67834 Transcript_17487/m.67834 type:complete len:96 (+) Transcript_17487:24-311(+)
MDVLDKLNLRWSYMAIVVLCLFGAVILALAIFGGVCLADNEACWSASTLGSNVDEAMGWTTLSLAVLVFVAAVGFAVLVTVSHMRQRQKVEYADA